MGRRVAFYMLSVIIIFLSIECTALAVITFKGAKVFGTGIKPQSVAVGDFNNDGCLDVAVANELGFHSLSILMGRGNGTFLKQTVYDLDNFGDGKAVVIGDLNKDGKIDLVVADEGHSTVAVFLGKGDGTFQTQKHTALNGPAHSIALGDFNGDGKADLVVTDNVYVSVLLGNGNGTFQTQKIYYRDGSHPEFVTIGDFNRDGKLDLAVANAGSNNISILLGNGNGTFLPHKAYTTGNQPSFVTVGDFNGDNKVDLVVANSYVNDWYYASENISILLGRGNGGFITADSYAAGSIPVFAAIGDFNKDGNLDMAVTNAGSDNVSVLLGNGDRTFMPQKLYAVGITPISISVGDFNKDGKSDLIVLNNASNNVSILLGRGDGTFMPQKQYALNLSYGRDPSSLAVGDFNNDGNLDFVVSMFMGHNVEVRLGRGDGSFQLGKGRSAGSSPYFVAVSDFNGDGKPDLAVTNPDNGFVVILIGKGDGTFLDPIFHKVYGIPNSLAIGDFNGDGISDIAASNLRARSISVLLGNGDGSFQNRSAYMTGNEPSFLVAGDFNGDGHVDLAINNVGTIDESLITSGNSITTLKGMGDGTFSGGNPSYSSSNRYFLAAGDFNNDGRLDLLMVDPFSDKVSILYNSTTPYSGGPSVITPNKPE